MPTLPLALALLACPVSVEPPPVPGAPEAALLEITRSAREALDRRGAEGLESARARFEDAIALAPDFAPAHAGLAAAHALVGDYGPAEAAARRALELDVGLAWAHAVRGFVLLHARWDWPAAERAFRAALALDPGDALAHHWYAVYLEAMGAHERALAAARTAAELAPAVPAYALGVGHRLFWARRYADAIEHFRRLLAGDPDRVSAHYFLARSWTELGRHRKAAAALETTRRLAPGDLNVAAAGAYLAARSGSREEARAGLRELERFAARDYPLATQIASVHAALGNRDAALHWLERAHRRREGPLVWLAVDIRFDALRVQPRFAALLEQMALSAASSASGNRRR